MLGDLELKIKACYQGKLPNDSRAVATLHRYRGAVIVDLPCRVGDDLQKKTDDVVKMTARLRSIIDNFDPNKDRRNLQAQDGLDS